ncbi:MAG: ABC transporter transmembrane domain-containing protein [Rhodanobacter sp.]|jgi:ATP-binding cassette subfamily B protein
MSSIFIKPVDRAKLRSNVSNLRETFLLAWSQMDAFVKLRLAMMVALVLASAALSAFAPVVMKWIVDGFTSTRTSPPLSWFTLVGVYVVTQWLTRTISESRGFLYSRVDRRIYRTISSRLFDHIMRLPLRFHLSHQTGGVTQVMNNGLQGYQTVMQHIIFTFLPVLAELATLAIFLVHFHQSAFLVMFILGLVCYGGVFAAGVAGVAEPARAVSNANIDANAVMTDSLLNYETVKYFAAEPVVRERFDHALTHTEAQWRRFFRVRVLNGVAVATVFAAFLGLSLFYAAWKTHKGSMTVGDFVLISAYMLQVVRPVEMLGMATQQLSQAFAFLEKMLELLHETPEELATNGNDSPIDGPGRLEFEDVCLAYSADRAILKHVSFQVSAGKTLGVVGASGAGKSTLVRLLVRLIEPDAGRILLDGIPLSQLSLTRLREAIAVVPQDTLLFDDTIGYNIAFGKPGCGPLEIEQAAKLAQLHEFIMTLPQGYDTRVGERGVKLSGGEKQRLSIARAAIKQPLIYVFDEATSSLDSRTEREILRNLREISRFSTTLVIAHRLSTVIHADEIVLLEAGTVLERGSHESLRGLNAKYASLWEAQYGMAVDNSS